MSRVVACAVGHQVGYEYVNSDDCWMLAARDAKGNQVPNPEKFPDGFSVGV